jgi:membrane associated rhomboid family serine protease
MLDEDWRWNLLEASDLFWIIIISILALTPFFYAFKDKTNVSLAMVLSLLLVHFIQYLLSFTERSIFSFEPIEIFGLIPALMNEGANFHRFITAAWLHADWIHVLSNILVIALVGVPLEQKLGSKKWLIVYTMGFIGGNLAWIFTHPDSMRPAIGASGAAFGLLGAYMACWPEDKIEFPLLFLIRAWPVWLIAFIRVGLEIFQIYSVQAGTSGETNVAHMAHLGGFFLAYISAKIIVKKVDILSHGDNYENGRREISRQKRQDMLSELDNDPWTMNGITLENNVSRILDKLRQEGDERETRRAWLEELAEQTVCPICNGEIIADEKNNFYVLKCVKSDNHLNWP